MRVHRGRPPITRTQAGVLAIVLILVGSYLGYTKVNPFSHPFEMKATFANGSNVTVRAPVRIAGVQVGEVKKIERAGGDSNATTITMTIKDSGLPIHTDARLKVRPRIFLEGNVFVDLQPGTPGAPEVKRDQTIPMAQTSAPVQLDQVLDTLRSPTRKDLQKLVQGYGDALGGAPTPEEDLTQEPAVQGKTGGQALNESLRYSPDALRGTAIVNQALQGTEPHDLSKLIANGGRVTAQVASRENQVQGLITNFNTVTGVLAEQQGNLRATLRLLPRVLEAANPTLTSLNRSFPPTRQFARAILPGLRETPASIRASLPWIAQVRRLVSKPELQGLIGDLQPGTADFARFQGGTERLLPQLHLVNRCVTGVILPAGDKPVPDGPFTTGVPNYKEFFQSLVGLSGESQNFDGNGQYTRLQTGGGPIRVTSGALPGQGKQYGQVNDKPLGSRPGKPSSRPPLKRNVPCYRNKVPNLTAKTAGGP